MTGNAETFELPRSTASSDMGHGMVVALALHALVAGAIVAWPGLPPRLDEAPTVEVMFTRPEPPPPPPEPVRAAEPPPSEPLRAAAPAPAAKPARIAAPRPAVAAPRAVSPSLQPVSDPSPQPAEAAETAAAAPPAIAAPTAAPPAVAAPVADTPPVALDTPRPIYPRMAKQRGWQGLVLLTVEVNELGCANTISIKQSSGHSLLDDSAVEAVRRWHFRPARKGGADTTAMVEIPVRFSLSEA